MVLRVLGGLARRIPGALDAGVMRLGREGTGPLTGRFNDEQAREAGLAQINALGRGLLANSGFSPVPITTGQALAAGIGEMDAERDRILGRSAAGNQFLAAQDLKERQIELQQEKARQAALRAARNEEFKERELSQADQRLGLRAEANDIRARNAGQLAEQNRLKREEALQPDVAATMRLRRQFERESGAFLEIGRAKRAVDAALADPTSKQAAQVAQVMLQRAIDPESVVRQSEFQRTREFQSLIGKAKTFALQVATGRPDEALLKDIQDTMARLADKAAREQQKRVELFTRSAARDQSIIGDDIIQGFLTPEEFIINQDPAVASEAEKQSLGAGSLSGNDDEILNDIFGGAP